MSFTPAHRATVGQRRVRGTLPPTAAIQPIPLTSAALWPANDIAIPSLGRPFMRRFINRILPIFSSARTESDSFRQPRFETRERSRTVDLDVFVPGVAPEDVDLVVDDSDLVVIARKPHAVRRNWQAANFEAVQSDYQLRVHLGAAVNPRAIWAVLRDGVLKIHFRRRVAHQRLELSVG
jgi:HSP20 family molecular chaperone IbpA